MPVVCESLSIKAVETTKICTYPKNSLMIYTQTYDYIIAEAIFIVWIMQILFECIVLPVKKNQSSSICTDPDVT